MKKLFYILVLTIIIIACSPVSWTQIGNGEVIKGWEIGVATMKLNEKSEFIISPQYAYGEKGFNDLIPANATLTFVIELL